MSDNPFISGCSTGFYSDFVKEQIKNLKVGESKKADIGIKTKSQFRSMITYSAASIGIKVKTKCSADGSVWVIRVY